MPRKEYELENPDYDYDEELDAIDDQELEGEIIDEIDANIDNAADKKKPEKAEYQKNKELQNQAELNKKKAQKPNEPEAEAKKDVNKPEAKDKKTTVLKNPYLGTVNAQVEINESLLDKQRKEVHSLRAMMYYVTDGEKRPEFTLVKKQLYNLEGFLARTAGRKKLTKKEMETYELLTMKAYKATAFYDKAMEKELRAKGGNFTKKDIKRLNAMDRIRESISQMRSNMYEKEMQRKKEAMQKKCEEKVQNMKETLDGLNHARYKDSQLREILTGAVVRTIFFMNRMDSLEKSICLHPGESVKKSTKRMNRDLRPTRQDMDRTARMELTQSIVDAGMKEIKAGNTFTTDDIVRLQKMYIRKNAARLAANRKRRKNLQNLKNRKSIRVPESGMKK